VVALARGGEVITACGEVHGEIARKPSGGGGFGYDPLFYIPEMGQTFAELPAKTKNRISHRAQALLALKEKLNG
jgi:XTP/dITP diphosphohydrolase